MLAPRCGPWPAQAERMSGWVPPDRREVPVAWAATLLISWAVVSGLRCLGPSASILLGEAGAIHGAGLGGTDGPPPTRERAQDGAPEL